MAAANTLGLRLVAEAAGTALLVVFGAGAVVAALRVGPYLATQLAGGAFGGAGELQGEREAAARAWTRWASGGTPGAARAPGDVTGPCSAEAHSSGRGPRRRCPHERSPAVRRDVREEGVVGVTVRPVLVHLVGLDHRVTGSGVVGGRMPTG